MSALFSSDRPTGIHESSSRPRHRQRHDPPLADSRLRPRFHRGPAFGAGLATDAFFVAFKLPNLLRRMFAEAPFPGLRPHSGEYKNKRGDAETRVLVNHVATILTLVLFAVTALGVAAPRPGLDLGSRLRRRRRQVPN